MVSRIQSSPPQPLPTSRDLGRQWGLCHSTVFRILVELSHEGIVWQHPNGRFFAASSRIEAVRGLPVALIGRQMGQWSYLYREILEGISEVCTAAGLPLMLLSSNHLVEHADPKGPPQFASVQSQIREIKRLNTMLPKQCSAVIFDHAWQDDVLTPLLRPEASNLLLMRSSEIVGMRSVLPDYFAGAKVALRHVVECGYEEVQMAIPFANDQSVDQCARAFVEHFALAGGRMNWREPWDCQTSEKRNKLIRRLRRASRRVAVVVLEDNIAMLLHKELERCSVEVPSVVGIISLQGTTGSTSPLTRVRYDYRRLGRSAIGAVLSGQEKEQIFPPTLIKGRTTSVRSLSLNQ
jgi:DNA-binding LacI/PurR family transcriptional regulator